MIEKLKIQGKDDLDIHSILAYKMNEIIDAINHMINGNFDILQKHPKRK